MTLGSSFPPLEGLLPYLLNDRLSLGLFQGSLTALNYLSLSLQAKILRGGGGIWKGAADVISDGNASL